jgi:hypothetical protein
VITDILKDCNAFEMLVFTQQHSITSEGRWIPKIIVTGLNESRMVHSEHSWHMKSGLTKERIFEANATV